MTISDQPPATPATPLLEVRDLRMHFPISEGVLRRRQIGEVKAVKGGEATIQMGSDTFTVDTNKLGVSNGVASINATQAELKKMLPPKK